MVVVEVIAFIDSYNVAPLPYTSRYVHSCLYVCGARMCVYACASNLTLVVAN